MKTATELNQDSADTGVIRGGTFIRVKADHHNQFRAGLDGMVYEDCPPDSESIALVFGTDRYNHFQHCECVGPELWLKVELDMGSAF